MTKIKLMLVPRLITDDVFALNTAILKLENKAGLGWSGAVRSYNGSVTSPKTVDYLSKIKGYINNFKRCGGY